jgi:excisionase family DNA binding protein
MQKLKTAKEIGEILNLNPQRIYELTRQGLIPHVVIGVRQYRYSEIEIENWLQKGGNSAQKSSSLRDISRQPFSEIDNAGNRLPED